MNEGNNRNQTQLILQALAAAESSINLAKQLLSSSTGVAMPVASLRQSSGAVETQPSSRSLPGIIGKFDGEFMTSADGKKFPVPANYASKSQIVFGDTLKLIDSPDGHRMFKQIERVKRARATGVLAKKDGRFCVVTSDGSYKVLPSSVSFHSGLEGDEVIILLPLNEKHVPFAAVESIPARANQKKVEPTGANKAEVKPVSSASAVSPKVVSPKIESVKKEPEGILTAAVKKLFGGEEKEKERPAEKKPEDKPRVAPKRVPLKKEPEKAPEKIEKKEKPAEVKGAKPEKTVEVKEVKTEKPAEAKSVEPAVKKSSAADDDDLR